MPLQKNKNVCVTDNLISKLKTFLQIVSWIQNIKAFQKKSQMIAYQSHQLCHVDLSVLILLILFPFLTFSYNYGPLPPSILQAIIIRVESVENTFYVCSEGSGFRKMTKFYSFFPNMTNLSQPNYLLCSYIAARKNTWCLFQFLWDYCVTQYI